MKLLDIVVRKAIIPTLVATDRDAAIAEIIDAMVEAGTLSPKLRDEFVKAVVKRENRGSTGFGHGVAVPHVKHAAISKMAVAVAISQTGVDFNALDRQPVFSIRNVPEFPETGQERGGRADAAGGGRRQGGGALNPNRV
jgi:mannitol/fructose-specific phosphotransferase system IIA component (Ntr-type)